MILHGVPKSCKPIFSVSVKYKLISTKMIDMWWNKHLTKVCKKEPLHLRYVLALPWEIRGDGLNCQRSTYVYISINHRIATSMTGSNCLKTRQTCSNSYHLYITCSKCPPLGCRRTETTHQKTTEQSDSESRCSLNLRLASLR